MQRFDVATLPATRWKNGGGATREIAVWPPGTGMDDFGWRASVATISQDGAFSVFPGIDRHIMLLAGAGVQLRSNRAMSPPLPQPLSHERERGAAHFSPLPLVGEGAPAGAGEGSPPEHDATPLPRVNHRLDTRWQPFAFPGDEPLTCTRLNPTEPSTDFNIMTRRGQWRAEVLMLETTTTPTTADAGLCMALAGRWRVDEEVLTPEQGLWWSTPQNTLTLHADTSDACLVCVLLHRLEPES